jgi:hypothetical protein
MVDMEPAERGVGQYFGELVVRCPHLLQANDIWAAPSKPRKAAASVRSSNPIDVGSNDAHDSPINPLKHAQ